MLTDIELKRLADEIDQLLLVLCERHKVGPLSLSGVILSRLLVASRKLGYEEDLNGLLEIAIGDALPSPDLPESETIH